MGRGDGSKQTYRNSAYPILGGMLILIVWCFALVVAVLQPIWVAPIVAVGAGAISWVVYRVYVRARVVSDTRGVTVVNPFRTVALSWDEVDHFSAGRMLAVVPKAGQPIIVWAVQAANAARMLGRRSFADDVASDLNRLMLAAQGQAGQAS